MMANDQEVKYLVPGLERGLQLLLAFGEQHRELTFAELHRLVDTVPQITNREENVAEIAAYRGQMLFYFDRDYYTLAELVRLPGRKKYSACVYIDADGSRQDRPGYANDIALQVDEWRRENGIPFDKSTIAARPSEVDGGEFDTMDEALRYLYTCLNFPDSVLC